MMGVEVGLMRRIAKPPSEPAAPQTCCQTLQTAAVHNTYIGTSQTCNNALRIRQHHAPGALQVLHHHLKFKA